MLPLCSDDTPPLSIVKLNKHFEVRNTYVGFVLASADERIEVEQNVFIPFIHIRAAGLHFK